MPSCKVGSKRLQAIISYYLKTNDFDATANKFGIKRESLSRYLRLYRKNQEPSTAVKVLLLDIETLPMIVQVWGLYKQRIPHTNILEEWIILSWAAKWLFSDKMMSDIVTVDEALNRQDERILGSIAKLINKADIVIAHNGRKFDMRKLKARFLIHKMPPTSPYQLIDTLKVAQREFALSSHRLDYLGKIISNQGKLDTDWELWNRCRKGEQKALDEMLAYNEEDVMLLEEVYLELRPWMHSHPNIGVYTDTENLVCPTCGDGMVTPHGYYVTPAGRYQAYECLECGAYSRGKHSTLPKEKQLLRSIAG